MFFGHKQCKSEIHKLIQTSLDDQNKIKSLELTITQLLSQIHELKAINNYESLQFEDKLASLTKENSRLIEELDVCKKQLTEGQHYD